MFCTADDNGLSRVNGVMFSGVGNESKASATVDKGVWHVMASVV